jgi:transketolase
MPANPEAKLVGNILDPDSLKQIPIRNGFGEGLVQAADEDRQVVALCADLTESTRTKAFAEKYPERFVEIGVAEQNLATVAAGMSAAGKIPYISSYAVFSPGRNWEQIRTTICYNDRNVKVCGAHAGISVGPDGATHQAIEDIAIMRVLPNMRVFTPCDAVEARKITYTASKENSPCYIRYAREKTPVFTTEETPFAIGKAQIFWQEPEDERPDVAIVACGSLVHNAILAAAELEKEGIKVRVINNMAIKPMDEETIVQAARDAGAIVTVEEHQVAGGLGSAIAEVLARRYPVPVEFIGVYDKFGQSGTPEELIKHYGMDVESIKEAVIKAINRK